jgi:hypothetical protein
MGRYRLRVRERCLEILRTWLLVLRRVQGPS